jgi:type II secretory pathway component PulJ
MKLNPRRIRVRFTNAQAGFTLAEVLAALLFIAIVVPVAVQGLRVASLAGEVAERKAQASRIAERLLNDALLVTNYSAAAQSGVAREGLREFQWTIQVEPWDQQMTNRLPMGQSAFNQIAGSQPQVDAAAVSQIEMNLLSVEVRYPVQSTEYSVRLNTLVP